MKVSFNFNEREFRRLVNTEVKSAVNDLAKRQTREIESLRQRYRGRPIEEIKPALQRVFAKDGGKITDPELSEWAQMISDGTRIEFKLKEGRW